MDPWIFNWKNCILIWGLQNEIEIVGFWPDYHTSHVINIHPVSNDRWGVHWVVHAENECVMVCTYTECKSDNSKHSVCVKMSGVAQQKEIWCILMSQYWKCLHGRIKILQYFEFPSSAMTCSISSLIMFCTSNNLQGRVLIGK